MHDARRREAGEDRLRGGDRVARGALLVLLAFAAGLAGACATSPPVVKRHGRDGVVPLATLRGKVVLINYWATWCQPCMDEIPALVRVAAEYEDRVVLLAVSELDDFYGPPRVARLKKNPASFTRYIVYGNSGLTSAFPRRAFPTTYVLDVNGELVEKVVGALTVERARALIRAALERPRR